MAALSSAPKLLKGAMVAFRLPDPTPQVIAFQYNPATQERSFEPQTTGGGEGAPGEAFRLTGVPVEKIKIDVEIDATDQLDAGSAAAAELGIHPQLALLELLLYPHSALVVANTVLLAVGTIEIIPTQGPFVLFIWGKNRILPVRIGSFSISEEEYDNNLNPIRAKVSLELRVLSTNDLAKTSPGYHLFMAHHMTKEAMALVAKAQALTDVLGGETPLL
jgi:hypothetical protein